MSGVTDALVAQLLKEGDTRQSDPMYKYGAEFAQSGPALSQAAGLNPWESLLVNALSGLGGGAIQGISQRLAKPSTTSQALTALLMPDGPERDKAFEDPDLAKYKTVLDIEQRIKQQDSKEEAANFLAKQELQQIADAQSGKTTREVNRPDGSSIQEERYYDPETKQFGWKPYGQEPGIYDKKLFEASAERAAGNSLYGGGFDPEKTAALEDSLRKETEGNPAVDQFIKGETAFQSMNKAYSDKTGTSDLDFMYGAVQTREPGLAVKGDDQALLREAAGLGGVFATAAGYVKSGAKLPPSLRASMLQSASNARDARIDLVTEKFQKTQDIATRRKIDVKNALPFDLPKKSKEFVEKTIGGELWQDPEGNNWVIKKDANGTPISREKL